MAPKPKYISISEARYITGRKTDTALVRFVQNYNYKNLDDPILRIPGYVEENSLLRALDKLAKKHTPGLEIRRAVASGVTRR